MGEKLLFVGTSGYSYAHWRKGIFYPVGLKTKEWLSYYAASFNTVELNISFYRRPRLEDVRRWAEATPPGFVFAAKLNRMVTHYKKLRSCTETLRAEQVLADGLGPKLGVVLAQLPPSFAVDMDALKGFLDEVRSGTGRWIPRLAFEFRHMSWFQEPVYRLLTEYRAAVCVADWGAVAGYGPNEVEFLYVRRHSGRNGGDYAPDQIAGDAGFVRDQLNQGKKVYVYYNNDYNAYAIKNARELLDRIGGG